MTLWEFKLTFRDIMEMTPEQLAFLTAGLARKYREEHEAVAKSRRPSRRGRR